MDFIAQSAGLASLVRKIIVCHKHGYFRDGLQMVKTMPPNRTMKETGNRKEKANSARRYMVEEKGKIDRQSKRNLQDEYKKAQKRRSCKGSKGKENKERSAGPGHIVIAIHNVSMCSHSTW
jgi:hypothetical protein